MPGIKTKSSFDFNKALKAHAGDATEYPQDFSRLPGGVVGGIARIVSAGIGTYKTGANVGQQFVRLAAVAVSPDKVVDTIKELVLDSAGKVVLTGKKDAKGKPIPQMRIVSAREMVVKGLQTSLVLPLCGTGKGDKAISAEDNLAEMLNVLRTIGGQDFTADIEDEDGLKAKLELLQDTQPHVRFGTRRPDPTIDYPDSRVFEAWYGSQGLENYVPEESAAVTDRTTTPSNDARTNGAPPNNAVPAAKAATAPVEQTLTEEESQDYDPEELRAVAEAADGGDIDAAEQLTGVARDAGKNDEEITNADSWSALVEELLEGQRETVETPAEEESESWKPTKGNTAMYKIVDPKNKKVKTVECDVLAIDAKAKTATLKRLDNKVQIKGVELADLKEPS